MLIDKTSVSRTVDAINAALFDGRPVAAEDRENAGRWLATRAERALNRVSLWSR